jgi:hypothetical protein
MSAFGSHRPLTITPAIRELFAMFVSGLASSRMRSARLPADNSPWTSRARTPVPMLPLAPSRTEGFTGTRQIAGGSSSLQASTIRLDSFRREVLDHRLQLGPHAGREVPDGALVEIRARGTAVSSNRGRARGRCRQSGTRPMQPFSEHLRGSSMSLSGMPGSLARYWAPLCSHHAALASGLRGSAKDSGGQR